MQRRAFLVAVAFLYGSFALAAWIAGLTFPQIADAGAVLLATLSAIAFGGAAWVEGAAPRDACGRCGRAGVAGLSFCAACGADEPNSPQRVRTRGV